MEQVKRWSIAKTIVTEITIDLTPILEVCIVVADAAFFFIFFFHALFLTFCTFAWIWCFQSVLVTDRTQEAQFCVQAREETRLFYFCHCLCLFIYYSVTCLWSEVLMIYCSVPECGWSSPRLHLAHNTQSFFKNKLTNRWRK